MGDGGKVSISYSSHENKRITDDKNDWTIQKQTDEANWQNDVVQSRISDDILSWTLCRDVHYDISSDDVPHVEECVQGD